MTQEQNFDINDGQNFGVSNVAEFYNDVHVYGKLYADLVGGLSGDGGSLTVDQLIVDNNATINLIYLPCFQSSRGTIPFVSHSS